MKFASFRDIRNNPSGFRELVEQDDVVLTASGKPFAIAVSVAEEDLEATLDLLRRVRALRAMTRMQDGAAGRGLSDMPLEKLEEEIRKARRKRRRSA